MGATDPEQDEVLNGPRPVATKFSRGSANNPPEEAIDARKRELRSLGAILHELRVRAGMTQEGLAQALGRSQSFVTKYEPGRRRLDIVELDRTCGALEVTFEECVRRFTSR